MQRFPRAGAVAAVVMFVLAIPASAHAFVTHDEFDVDDFSDPTHIDNPYLPMVPGTQLVFTGTASGEAHEVIFTATDVTKVINGVNTLVLFDQDLSEGTLLEAELAFFAQDDEGNVWAMGEYPEEFDEDTGEFLGAPSTWLAGVDGARPGVSMQADPQVGDPPYIQGFAPSVEFEDQGQVIEEDQSVCVAACFDDVIVVKETNLADPEDGFQFKFHAAGTGVVRITADLVDQTQEFLDLTEIRRLTSAELAEVRATVLEMDQRAYTVAAEVYGDTEPAVRDRIYGDDDPGDPDFDNPSPFDTAADPDAPGAGADPLVAPAPADPLGAQAGVTPPAGGTSPSVEPTSLLALEELPRTGLALEWAVPLGVLLVGAGRSLTSLTRRRRSA